MLLNTTAWCPIVCGLQFKTAGAFTLSYSTNASQFWSGLTALTGEPISQADSSLIESMEYEHCDEEDSMVMTCTPTDLLDLYLCLIGPTCHRPTLAGALRSWKLQHGHLLCS